MAYDSITIIADEIFEELGQPSEVVIPSIAFWLRSNIGKLNNHLNTEFILAEDQSVSPLVDNDAAVVFKKMYEVYFYDKKIKDSLNLAATNPTKRVSSDGMSVEVITGAEIAKTWLESKKQLSMELRELINAYKIDKNRAVQVAGNDTTGSTYYYVGNYIRTFPETIPVQ